ncbi:MAG: MATE family efflux transporter [Peptostreptococcaceae bacterium]|nr:MATE family efflux transporter [Peptostreptococcaceae bacterium]MDY5738412.1 MATE family efflux transporter [Anaerovoracaceae bacterium]
MGTMPVGKLLISMAWPAIFSMTINALYNIVDSIFVGMLSEDALASVSLVMPIQMLMVSLGVGTGIGINSLIARRLGSRSFEEANKAASTGIRLVFFNYLVFAVIGLFLSGKFIGMFATEGPVFDQGVVYLKYISIGAFFILMQMTIEKILQSTGNMIAPMAISLTGAVINLILDPILIFGLFGLPRLEIAGAAIATLIGQFCAMSLGLYILLKKDHAISIKIRGFKFESKIIRDIYSVGLPTIVMQSIASIMILGYNSILSSSATAIAVLGIYFKLQSFIFMPVFGMNQGAMPIMGYNYGAKNKERLMETYKKGLLIAVVMMAVGTLIFHLFPQQLLHMFSASDNMIALGTRALRIISLCFIPAAFGIMTSTLFQATGYGVYSLYSALIRQLVGILPLAYFLMQWGGINASWFSFPIAEIIGLAYSAVMLRYLYNKVIK